MKKMVIIAVCLLMLVNAVSAEILFEQPKDLYNGGDEIMLNITLIPTTSTTDFLDVALECREGSIDLYRNPVTLRANERTNIPFHVLLDPHFIGSLNGTCTLDASYGSEHASSNDFIITKELLIEVNVDGGVYDPGESIAVSGNVEKRTGVPLDGFVTFTLSDIVHELTTRTTNGAFAFNVSLPATTPSGTYPVIIRAYEKNNAGDLINEGFATSYIVVSQVITKITAALSTSELSPGQELQYTVILSDQTGAPVEKELDVVVVQPNQSIYSRASILSGELQHLGISSSSMNGSWKIQTSYGSLTTQQEFTVAAVANASYTPLADGTLLVKNIGNIPYRKTAEITIGDVRKVIPIVLEKVGESKLFKLRAPDGTYGISVHDGEHSYALGSTFLTGGAVSVREVNTSNSGLLAWIVWGVIIAAIIVAVAITLGKAKRKSSFSGHSSSIHDSRPPLRSMSSESTPSYQTRSAAAPRHTPRVHSMPAPAQAMPLKQSMPTMNGGDKQEVMILALNVKNRTAVDHHPEAALVLSRAIDSGRASGAQLVRDGLYDVFYLPSSANSRSDIVSAVTLAQKMEQVIAHYNRTHVLKIEYTIGIHRGTMIVESKNGVKKYTALGNSVIVAKAATQRATNSIVLSESVRRTGVGALKGEPLPGGTYWKVHSVSNREDHSAFLNKFTRQNFKK